MAFNEELAHRVRQILDPYSGEMKEIKMFGGLAFMIRGHMSVGVMKDRLMVRVTKDHYEKALADPAAQPMDFTGKPLKNFVYVNDPLEMDDRALQKWADYGIEYAFSKPPK